MAEIEPRPIREDHDERLVAGARHFMALHPDVDAVIVTIVSRTIDPAALSTAVVGSHGPPVTPDTWLLAGVRATEAAQYCLDQAKGLMLGLGDLANNLAREVEALRRERDDAPGGGP